jgi:D-ribose pyranose/furanose isomerase RbsD
MAESATPSPGTIDKMLDATLNGGSKSVLAILLIIIVVLIFERIKLQKEIAKRDEKEYKELLELTDKYYKSKSDSNDSMHSIMLVLTKIEMKL